MRNLFATLLFLFLPLIAANAQSVGHGADIDAQIAGKASARQSKKASTEKKTTADHHSSSAEPTTEGSTGEYKLVLRKIKVRKKTPDEMPMRTKVTKGVHHEQGFRIQVFSGGNTRIARQQAERAGQKVKAALPNQPVYVHFHSPRWNCRVGNFKTYKSALPLLRKIRKIGYKGAIIIRSLITVKDIEYVDDIDGLGI